MPKKQQVRRTENTLQIKQVISFLILEENDLEVFPKGDETVLSQAKAVC